MRPFRGRFFRPRGIFEEGRISGFWGDLRGLCDLVRPHARACLSREKLAFLAFPLFLCFPLDFSLNPLYFSSWRLQ